MSDLDDRLSMVPTEALEVYSPSNAQSIAKARLHARLAERQGLTDVASLPIAELVTLSGDRRVASWLSNPSFATWFTDRDDFVHQAVAMKDLGIRTLEAVLLMDLEPKVCAVADKLKALDMLFKLTGAYPAKAPARWLDPELDAMSMDDVNRELASAKEEAKRGKG